MAGSGGQQRSVFRDYIPQVRGAESVCWELRTRIFKKDRELAPAVDRTDYNPGGLVVREEEAPAKPVSEFECGGGGQSSEVPQWAEDDKIAKRKTALWGQSAFKR